MSIPIHFLHVYQRPKQGSAFIRRHPLYNYQHSISNQGWFDTASCDISVRSSGEGFDILNSYLGCYVAVYVDNPAQPIWEGLINRIIFNAGLASYTISLDEMANRVSVVYTGAANAAAETLIVNNTASQAIYGIKQEQVEFGGDPSAGAQRTLLRDTILSQRAFPQTSVSQAQGQTNLVHLELIGVFHTLEWVKIFTGTGAGNAALSALITSILAGNPNGATFFDNADLSQVSSNGTGGPQQQRGISYWELAQKIAESGDGGNYWVAGVMPTDPNTDTRRFYYRQANSAVEYTAYQRDGLKPRTAYGQPVPPWLVVPDRGIRVNDLAVGFNSQSSFDPRTTYIQSIQYDANSQSVQWFGADDTTARAAFALKRGYKPLSKNAPNTAPTRVIVT